MPHNCSHHHHTSKKPDFLTVWGAIGEASSSFVSDAYWLGSLFDLATQLDDAGIGLSWYGLGFGTALSLLVTAGSVYSHSVLNINHQAPIDEQEAPEQEEDLAQPAESVVIQMKDTETQSEAIQVENAEASSGDEKESDHDTLLKHHKHKEKHKKHRSCQVGGLNPLQWMAAVGDLISHTGDNAGPLTFVAELALKNRWSYPAEIITKAGITLFAATTSFADARTCVRSMQQHNKEVAAHKHCDHSHKHEHKHEHKHNHR